MDGGRQPRGHIVIGRIQKQRRQRKSLGTDEKLYEFFLRDGKRPVKNKFAEKQFCSRYKKKWKYPEQVRKKLEAAENYMINADSLMDVANYLPFHFERLRGDRKDEWSIRLGNTGYRVTMIPCDENENEILEGDILANCKMIKIVKVTEVSNHYE